MSNQEKDWYDSLPEQLDWYAERVAELEADNNHMTQDLVCAASQIDRLKAEVEQLRTLLHDSQSRKGHCDCEGTCDCTDFWRHVRKVLGEE